MKLGKRRFAFFSEPSGEKIRYGLKSSYFFRYNVSARGQSIEPVVDIKESMNTVEKELE